MIDHHCYAVVLRASAPGEPSTGGSPRRSFDNLLSGAHRHVRSFSAFEGLALKCAE